MDWFERLTGFREESYDATRAKLKVEGRHLHSLVNGKSHGIGEFELPSLRTLRERAASRTGTPGRLKVSVVTGDVREMHQAPENLPVRASTLAVHRDLEPSPICFALRSLLSKTGATNGAILFPSCPLAVGTRAQVGDLWRSRNGGVTAHGRSIGHGGMPVDLPPKAPLHDFAVEFVDERLYPNDGNLVVGYNG
jgi:hypothetical protein